MRNYLRNGLIGLGALALTGCSNTEKIIFDGETSFGHTEIIKVDQRRPFGEPDDFIVRVSRPDSSWFFYSDGGARFGQKTTGFFERNNKSKVIVKDENTEESISYNFHEVSFSEGFKIGNGISYLEISTIDASRDLLDNHFQNMYDKIMAEASNSLIGRMPKN